MTTTFQILIRLLIESIKFSFSILGVGFTILEAFQTLNANFSNPSFITFTSVLLFFSILTIGYFLYKLLKTGLCRYAIPDTGMTISLKIANILHQKRGSILIGINDTLEYRLDRVGKTSLQGQLIKKYGQDWMKQVMDNYKSQHPLSNQNTYPYGTAFTACDPKNKQQFLFLVTSHLQEDGVPVSNVVHLKEALNQLFSSTSNYRNFRNTLYIPLIGSGLTGLTLPRQELAEMIAFHFIHQKNDCMAVHHLIITFRFHTLRQIKLLELSNTLDAMAKHCHNCLDLF